MRKLLFNLHLYGALGVGIFVVIIGVTGSIMAFEEDIDRLLNPKLFHVAAEGRQVPVAGLLQAAAKAYPGQRVAMMRLPQRPSDPASFTARGQKQVFLNPYTGAVLGERSSKTWLSTLHMLHLRLLMGERGATVVAGVTAVLLFLVMSGIYLWWPYKRFTVKWGATASRINFDLHNAAGIYSALFLLALGPTGIVIHFGDDFEKYLHKSAGTQKIGKNIPSVVQPGVKPITPDQAIESALAELPGATAHMISLPPNPKASYLVWMHFPEDLTPGGRSWVNVDQYSGKAVGFQNSRTVAMATRAITVNRAIHTGDIFGYPTKILVCLSGLMLIVQAITGYSMWWKKLRSKQSVPQTEAVAKASPAQSF
jgi:uncharacterized iron-regulated membrane protein